MTITLVLLAMIAAFLGLRLYSVLGKRTGHEQEPLARTMETREGARPASIPSQQQAEQRVDIRNTAVGLYEPRAEGGIRQIVGTDRNFDLRRFVDGAKSAYGMILEAFWEGDRETLRQLCDDDVYASFAEALDQREAAGETLDNRLVRIDRAVVVAASLEDGIGRLSVRFEADIAAVVRNSEGEVIAGSLDDAVDTRDLWTFSRRINSSNPAWILDETDEG